MAEVSFGIGGYNGKERRYLATVTADALKVNKLAEALQEVGFWTTVRTGKSVKEPTVIEIGEIIRQV